MATRATFRVDKIYRAIGGLTAQDANMLCNAIEKVASPGTKVTHRPHVVQLDATNGADSAPSTICTIESPAKLDNNQVNKLLGRISLAYFRFHDLELEHYDAADTPA